MATTAAAANSARVARQALVCAVFDHESHLSKNDVSCKTAHAFQISHPSRRLMGTSAQKEGTDDIDVAVQAVNER